MSLGLGNMQITDVDYKVCFTEVLEKKTQLAQVRKKKRKVQKCRQ